MVAAGQIVTNCRVQGGLSIDPAPAITRLPPEVSATARIRRRAPLVVVGVASLANGAALVFHILGGLPLPGLLAVTWTVAVVAVGGVAAVANPPARSRMLRTLGVGIAVGLVATLAYDATKALLSQLDPSPYDPFEATRIFGRILLGEGAGAAAITIAGTAFHFANGSTFGIAFAALFGRSGHISRTRGVVFGVGWALFLETFQLVLYPSWLGIGFLDEFRQISFLSHIVFGVSLGLLVPAGLRWTGRSLATRKVE